MITNEQVWLLRRLMKDGKTQETAAARSGMSTRTARQWTEGPLPSESRKARDWRTRADPFAGDEDVIEQLLRSDRNRKLQAKTVLTALRAERPGRYGDKHLRSLQRHIKRWRGLNGPAKDVIFPQTHTPGSGAHVDFTHATELEVTIAGVLLVHLFFHLRTAFSGWSYVELAFGETYEALIQGMQNAVWALGGVPAQFVLDNLSAASRRLDQGSKRVLTQRFADFIDFLDAGSRRINVRKSNENGIVEKGNDLVKNAVEQALILRGSREFATLDEYTTFVADVVDIDLNGDRQALLAEERAALKKLPRTRFPTWTNFTPKVRRWSTISVAGRIYSVPSRLIGETVQVRQYPNILEVRFAEQLVETFPRLRGSKKSRIDYRHIAWSLARKPGAFAHYRFREELFPTLTFRRAYDGLLTWRGERADVDYVRILHLAASTMETRVEAALLTLLDEGKRFGYAEVQERSGAKRGTVPKVNIGKPDLSRADRLIGGQR